MANPLRWFRRHQKIMLVVFGAILMAVFGLGSVVTMMPTGAGKDPEMTKVVVRWKGGDYTRQDLQKFRIQNYQACKLLYTLDQEKLKKEKTSFTRDADLITVIGDGSPEMVDEQIVTRLLLAQRALELGITVDEAMVEDYVQKLAAEPMSEYELELLNAEVNNRQVDYIELKKHLRTELLAQKMTQLVGIGLYPPNATQAYSFYEKINNQIECQVAAFPVEDFLSKVTETPSKAELKKLFDEGRYRYADPRHEIPGFKKERMIVINFLGGDLDTFVDNRKRKLEPEVVQAEYERLIEIKDPLVIEKVPVTGGETGGDPKKDDSNKTPVPTPADKKSDDKKSDDKKSDDKKSDDKKNKVENKKADGDKAGDKKESDKKKSDKKDSDKNSSISFRNEIFTSLKQDEKTKTEKQGKSDDTTAPQPPAGQDNTDKKQDNSKTKSADTKPADTKQQENKPKLSEQDELDKLLNKDDETKQKTRVRPLSEVDDEIRRRLVQADARADMEGALSEAEAEVQGYLTGYEIWVAGEKKDTEPQPLNLKKMADRLKLTYGPLRKDKDGNVIKAANGDPSINERAWRLSDMNENTVGSVKTFSFDQRFGLQQSTVGQQIFADFYNLRAFDPKTAKDFQNNRDYIYWITEKLDPEVLDFEQAKPLVEKYWRHLKAQELAKAAAERAAEKVRSQNAVLKSVVPAAMDTGAFTWFVLPRDNPAAGATFFQFGTTLADDGKTRVEIVNMPGEEFMQTAFSLQEPLDVGVAPNMTNEIYYVVQLTKRVPSFNGQPLSENYLMFLNLQNRMPTEITQVARRYAQQTQNEWLEEFIDDMGVEWLIY